MMIVLQSLDKLTISKVYVRDFGEVGDIFHEICLPSFHLTVRHTTNTHLLELHDVASQCTSLVTEYILHLAQLFIEARALHLRWRLGLLVRHAYQYT